MKILAPINSAEDIDILNPNKYNTEFFCGYLPNWWIKEYNKSGEKTGIIATPINNRNGLSANIIEFDELKKAVKKSKEYGTDLFLVLNAKYYPNYVYDSIKQYIDEIISAGITRVIVCDIGMLGYLNEYYPLLKVSVSCLNQVTNSMAVKFYSNFSNVDRIVFPRHMSVHEIENIVQEYPKMEFEYFIFSNKCLYDDGYCRGIHEFTPICKDDYLPKYYTREIYTLLDKEQEIYKKKDCEFYNWTNNIANSEIKGYCSANFGCTACSLTKLSKYNNVVSVKLSIRGHDVTERLRQVEMADAVLKAMQCDKCNETMVKKIISTMYGKDDLCESGIACIMV